MTQTITAPTDYDKKVAFAAYFVENTYWDYRLWLARDLYTRAVNATHEQYDDYMTYLNDMADFEVATEFEFHFDNEDFIAEMENNATFNFIWNCENDFDTAYATMVTWAFEEEEFDIFAEIAEKVFTEDEGTDAEACMAAIRENDSDTAFAQIVDSYVSEGDPNFINAASKVMIDWTNDIVDRF